MMTGVAAGEGSLVEARDRTPTDQWRIRINSSGYWWGWSCVFQKQSYQYYISIHYIIKIHDLVTVPATCKRSLEWREAINSRRHNLACSCIPELGTAEAPPRTRPAKRQLYLQQDRPICMVPLHCRALVDIKFKSWFTMETETWYMCFG
jgi:hypothetical protein